ncbi:hypothetical protein BJ165DRAFT_1519000 [Panaeolus papilionaceus]|nr:hypothetical protein BJ165DRAFT_1519000 [Panaeolus papilionaceus]
MSTLKGMIVKGPVHLRPVGPDEQLPTWCWMILMLGETGVGKSNFLETLHGDKSFGISGDQLEAVTQKVTAYELMNARCKPRFGILDALALPVFLVDTPGFSDSHTSELKVIKMIQEWLSKDRKPDDMRVVDRVWYFQRITDKRLSGSQIKISKLIKALLGSGKMFDAYVITTMWDTMWTSLQISQAEARFQELTSKYWKAPSLGLKFYNTQESALELVGTRAARVMSEEVLSVVNVPPITYGVVGIPSKHQIEFSRQLYELVMGRIERLVQRTRILDDELAEPDVTCDGELTSRLRGEMVDISELMAVLEKEKDELYPAAFMDFEKKRGFRDRLSARWNQVMGKSGD